MKVSAAICTAALAIASSVAAAQNYPTRPVRLVITYPPGGTTDFVGRPVAQKLSELLGQQVVVDNRGGAGGVIGTMIVAQALPDGYTLLLGTSAGMLINPLLQAKPQYDAFRDFSPISRTNINPQALVANAALPVNNVKELIAYAKAYPGKLNAASSGIGTPNHLGTEMLKHLAKVDIVHVAYKGGGPAMTDLIAGQVQMQFSSIPTVLTHVKAGRIKILAIGDYWSRMRTRPCSTTHKRCSAGSLFNALGWRTKYPDAGVAMRWVEPDVAKVEIESDQYPLLASAQIEQAVIRTALSIFVEN